MARAGVSEEVLRQPDGGVLRVAKVHGKMQSVTFVPGPQPKTAPDGPGACTDCGAPSDRLRWFPFTTYACPACAAKRDARIGREQRTGDLCLRCGQPRSICTC